MKKKAKEAEDMHVNYHSGIGKPNYWQMDVSKSVFPVGMDDDPMGAFLPRSGKDRPQPHVKINECDH